MAEKIEQLELFYKPKDRLRATVNEERSYLTVKSTWAAPQSFPDKYLALLDGKGDEIAMIEDPKTLTPPMQEVIERELRLRYLTASVDSVISAKQEFGATYWHVATDRGEREFVTQSLQENALWFSDTHLLLLDVDGNRFELEDISKMDAKSQATIHSIL